MEKFITTDVGQTRKMGEMLAKELKGGEIICMEGELGSGKTSFAQGILKGLKVEGPYTSPTFVIMKKYESKESGKKPAYLRGRKAASIKSPLPPPLKKGEEERAIYHIDAYRVNSVDILELGWEEIIKNKNNVIIIEWADRIKKIIPDGAIWMKFEIMDGVETPRRGVSTEVI